MKTIIIILFLIVLGTKEAKPNCLDADIILVIDFSSSVVGYEEFMGMAITAFVKNLDLNDNGIKIGIITFASVPRLRMQLTSNKAALISSADSIFQDIAGGNTYIGDALEDAKKELGRGRPDVKKKIILISDGETYREEHASKTAKEIREKNIKIYGIFVDGDDSDPDFLESICSEGEYHHTTYDYLVAQLVKLDICS